MFEEVPQVTARSVYERMQRGEALTLLDVREAWEVGRAYVYGTLCIPLGELPRAVEKLDPNAEYVVMCHHGHRSDSAAQWLRRQGFSNVSNLTGGIDAWSREVDPSIARY